jgi:hypothetical protein
MLFNISKELVFELTFVRFLLLVLFHKLQAPTQVILVCFLK